MHSDAVNFAHTCLECDRLRGPSKGFLAQGTLQQIDTSHFNEVIEVDVLGPLLKDKNYSFIFIIVDHFSGFTLLVPTATNDQQAFKSAIELWYSIFGWPTLIYSDQGSSLTAKAINNLLSANGVTHEYATSHHHAAVGLVERKVGDVLRALQRICGLAPYTWATRLPMIQRAINSGRSASRGVSPDQAVFLSAPKSSVRLFTKAETDILGTTPQQLALQANTAIDHVNAIIAETKSLTQKQYEASFKKRNANVSFEINQLVWVTYPGSQKVIQDVDNPSKQKTTKLSPRRLLAVITGHQPETSVYQVEFFRPDDDKVTKRDVHVNRITPCSATLTKDEAELAARIPGTHAPEKVLGHVGTSLDDLRFLIKWVDLPDEYNTSEPYEFIDLKGKRHSVGETAVVQQYIKDNNIDVFGTATEAPSPTLPFPDATFTPPPHAPAPPVGTIVDFKPQDVAFSTTLLDYVQVLQHLAATKMYSVRQRDGFITKVAAHTLLHPAEALALHLTTMPHDDWPAEFDDKDITPPMSPTLLADPASTTSPAHFFSTQPPRDAAKPFTAGARKTRGKQSDKIAAREAFLTARGPLGPPKFKKDDIVSHVNKPVQGRILGGGIYIVSQGHADRVYEVRWEGDSHDTTEEEERMSIYRPLRNRDTAVASALSLIDTILTPIESTGQNVPTVSMIVESQIQNHGSTFSRDGGAIRYFSIS